MLPMSLKETQMIKVLTASWYPFCTIFNTAIAISFIYSLFTPSATPLTAFLAITFSIIAFLGLMSIDFKRKGN